MDFLKLRNLPSNLYIRLGLLKETQRYRAIFKFVHNCDPFCQVEVLTVFNRRDEHDDDDDDIYFLALQTIYRI